MSLRNGIAFVASGPSGVGKSSICRAVVQADSNLHFSVSCTTRAPRPDEVDGRDYYFLSHERFLDRITHGHFLEYAEVHGNYYGTPASEFERHLPTGADLLLDIDVQGAMQIQTRPEAEEWRRWVRFVFIGPPSFQQLEERLRHRATEEEAVIRRRLQVAEQELEHWRRYDYLIVNEDKEHAVAEFRAIVRAERLRVEVLGEQPPWQDATLPLWS